MFGSYDKVSLSLVNAADVDGKILPFTTRLPLDLEDSIPSNIASVDVYEYQEGSITGGYLLYTMYVGFKSTIDEMVDLKDGNGIQLKNEIEIPSVDTPVCYQIINGKKLIFAVLDEDDIVVKNSDELKHVLLVLSDNYKEFKNSS